MKKIILAIDGMTCSACSNGLEKYLKKQKGIISASVNLVMENAFIEYDESILGQQQLEQFVTQAGFKSLGIYKENIEEKKNEKDKINLIIFGFLSIIIMYIAMGHMINLPLPKFLNMMNNPIQYSIALLILTIPFIFYGFDILRNGYKNLIHKTPNMDTLVGIGVVSSFLYSLYSLIMLIRGNTVYVEKLYFESTAIVIFFIKLGRYINGITTNKTKSAIQKLVQITPKNAVIRREGIEKIVTIDEIIKGDTVICKPGDRVAVDGKITNGEAHFDESFITGESKPAKRGIDQQVIAGSINYDGYIEYTAEKIGKESTISEIVKLVVQATSTKAPIAQVADKVSSYFVPIVMSIALVGFISYIIMGYEFSAALNVFVSILVIACPCSLGLATPLAIVVSEGLCASNGILVKSSEVLENASKATTIVFDKTGTLTYGKLKIEKVISYNDFSKEEILKIASALENKSTHPISMAFKDYFKENEYIDKIENFNEISGYGIIGKVKNAKLNNVNLDSCFDTKKNNELNHSKTLDVILGNRKLLEDHHILIDEFDEEELSKNGDSIIYVSINNKLEAIIGVNDVIRENSKALIEKLKEMKIESIMLTGDNSKTANVIANNIGINEVISNVTPSQKAEVIEKLKRNNKFVIMCGDGINDSPALANSNIGISINSAADIAIDTADVICIRNDLNSIIDLIKISKNTIKNIKQNLFWAFFYNALMIPIALGILSSIGIMINPMIASIAMMLSSLTVILNALRLKFIKIQ